MHDKLEACVYLTTKCQLNCKHCYFNKNNPSEITMEQLRTILDKYPVKKTVFLGGEPLLYKDIDKAITMFPNVTISTNGYLVPQKIDILKDVTAVQMSIEGEQKYNDYIRGAGHWKVMLQALKTLKKHDIETYLRLSYSRENLSSIPRLIQFAVEQEVPLIMFPRTDLPPLSMKEQIQLFNTTMHYPESRCFIAIPNYFRYVKGKGRCPACYNRINFTTEGQVTPCNMDFENILGTLDDSYDFIYQQCETFLRFTKLPADDCMTCPHVDKCQSGCHIAKTWKNCPLQQKYSIDNFFEQIGIDTNIVVKRFSYASNYLSKIVSC